MKALFLLLLALCTNAGADDMFVSDGLVPNVTRSLTASGRTLNNCQIGARTATGGYLIHHQGGVTVFSEKELPPLWLQAINKRDAARLAPAGATPAHLAQIAAALKRATQRADRPLPFTAARADGTPTTGWVLALTDSEMLIATPAGTAWVTDKYFADPTPVRDELLATLTPEFYRAARARAVIAAKAESLAVADRDAAMDAWDMSHHQPLTAEETLARASAVKRDPFAARDIDKPLPVPGKK